MLSRKNSVLVVALTILAVLAGTAGVAQATLVGYWKLDETTAGPVLDSSGGGWHGALGGGATEPTVNQTPAIIGTSYLFNGGTGSVRSEVSTPLFMNGYAAATWSTWIYWPGPTFPMQLQWALADQDKPKGDPYGEGTWMYTAVMGNGWPTYGGSTSLLTVGTTSGTGVAPSGLTSPPSTGAWHLLTSTYDKDASTNKTSCYVDGVFRAGSDAASGTLRMTYFYIGGRNCGSWCVNGYMDDVGAWNNALTGTEVGALYNAPRTFTTDATAGFYGAGDMQTLFDLYAAGTGTAAIGGKTWNYSTTGFNQTAGAAWISGGYYYVQLGASDGVTAIPEPSTLALLAAGLVGLLCYAWRKRR